jgi:hypothetical protein
MLELRLRPRLESKCPRRPWSGAMAMATPRLSRMVPLHGKCPRGAGRERYPTPRAGRKPVEDHPVRCFWRVAHHVRPRPSARPAGSESRSSRQFYELLTSLGVSSQLAHLPRAPPRPLGLLASRASSCKSKTTWGRTGSGIFHRPCANDRPHSSRPAAANGFAFSRLRRPRRPPG